MIFQSGGIKDKVDHREEGLFRIFFLQRTDYILTKEQLIHIQKASESLLLEE